MLTPSLASPILGGTFLPNLWSERILFTAGIVLLAFGLLAALIWAKSRLLHLLEQVRHDLRPIKLRTLEILSARQKFVFFKRCVIGAHLGAALLVIAAALLGVSSEFPSTRGYVIVFLSWIWQPLRNIIFGVAGYLPELITILVILFVLRVALRAVRFIFNQADRGTLSLEPWVHREVARPTGQIIRGLLVVLAMFFIVPMLPGMGTSAAQGISVILGLMVTFGSTTTVGNLVAGVVLTYMRPFRTGDWVQTGDTFGEVLESRFLYVRLRTVKNEDVIVPSLQALSASIHNFSARAKEQGLILHTSVTIGYGSPWRKVHELLIAAAAKTDHVLQDPKPFVLQTALNDFYVAYEINAYTDRPDRLYFIYSDLRQNIQDTFNEGGVEIMSPHYTQLRDGNRTTIPDDYLPKTYDAPRLRLESRVVPGA
ncbi:MAG TPA: mechanosensitive ion channel domain-containing protein [Terriglobales bacterium]|nr:mechanosensitive ion channel domain-containing protein [Terriglobales bacterium]HUL14915.1 mechanosensitive ion channel domain-containing protein [Terriglobales bacterium]